MSILFAATYPEKTTALIVYGTWAKGSRSEDYPWVLRKEQFERWIDAIPQSWGDPETLVSWAPVAAHDEIRKQWWGKLLRLGASHGDLGASMPTGRPVLIPLGMNLGQFPDGQYLAQLMNDYIRASINIR